MDWTKLTKDPLDDTVRNKIISYLLSIRKILPKNNYDNYLIKEITNKTVLDIGCIEHTMARISNENWKHKLICEKAKYVLGIDILDDLIKHLKKRGYNIINCDATSGLNLNRKFQIIHVGDVIEHVNSPVDLLKFCYRHLQINGKIIVRTPNPYHHHYVDMNKRVGTDKSNLEHMFYILPTHALEIGRRANLKLKNYYVQRKRGLLYALYLLSQLKFKHSIAELFAHEEQYSTIYIYEFKK